MKRPRDMVTTPHDGWRYKQPETGKEFFHTNLNVIYTDVWRHRMALPDFGMDVSGGWKDRLKHDLCVQDETLPCEDTEDKGRWIGLGDVFNFIRSVTEWTAKGFPLVSQEESERRATICTSGMNGLPCKHNEMAELCLGCKGAARLISAAVGNRTTSHDSNLHICTACGGCALRAKVHIPTDVIHVDRDRLPSWCWQAEQVDHGSATS